MQPDPEYLRRQYDSLSDEALLEIDRSQLVEIAKKCYDAELAKRELNPHGGVQLRSRDSSSADVEEAAHTAPGADEEEPDWLDEAVEVYSLSARSGADPGTVADARDALEAAGIECYMELSEIPPVQNTAPPPTHLWRLLVPGNLNLRATSILERDIFNQEFEEVWRAHLEAFSDDELKEVDPQAVFCGLLDRIERVMKAYEEELVRRGLKQD